MKTSILMVCLGNICRSPLAEGILKDKLPKDQFVVESAGTAGYHIGRPPDPRSIEIANQNGIDISRQSARQFTADDFQKFDKIFVMDSANLKAVKQIAPSSQDIDKVSLLIENKDVPDPYYGNEDGFKKVFELIDQACEIHSTQLKRSQS
ncbi:MAG: low molecular weight protein-tyrosine-phosphatase [Flavobacteriaceae bacterium]